MKGRKYDNSFCEICGFPLRHDTYKYCPNCGQLIDWKEAFCGLS